MGCWHGPLTFNCSSQLCRCGAIGANHGAVDSQPPSHIDALDQEISRQALLGAEPFKFIALFHYGLNRLSFVLARFSVYIQATTFEESGLMHSQLVNLSAHDGLYPRGQDSTSFEKSCKSLTSWRIWCPVDIVLWGMATRYLLQTTSWQG